MNALKFSLKIAIFLALWASIVVAETLDVGGIYIKGAGDKESPRCQVSFPSSATAPFFIAWHCVDNIYDEDEIITELWVMRRNAPRFVKIDDFLGFPASVQVNDTLLQEPIDSGLPASFRLVARDPTGNTTISPFFTITNRSNDLSGCTLELSTRSTESNGETTGLPEMQVLLSNVEVFTQSSTNDSFTISMFRGETASPCEISDICDDDRDDAESDKVSFIASITVSSGGSAEGRVSVTPGELNVNVSGTGSISGETLLGLDVDGVTTIDGLVTDLRLSCEQGGGNGGANPTPSPATPSPSPVSSPVPVASATPTSTPTPTPSSTPSTSAARVQSRTLRFGK